MRDFTSRGLWWLGSWDPSVWRLRPGRMMGTSERQLFRARFAWLCKRLLSDVCGGCCYIVKVVFLSARLLGRLLWRGCRATSQTQSVSLYVTLHCCCRCCALVADVALLSGSALRGNSWLWDCLFTYPCNWVSSLQGCKPHLAGWCDWTRSLLASCRRRQWNLLVFHAGSLVTVRSVKYDVSSLREFVSESALLTGTLCWLARRKWNCCLDNTSCNTLETVLLRRRQTQFISIHSCRITRIHVDFPYRWWGQLSNRLLRDVVPVRDCTILNGISQRQHVALVLRLIIDMQSFWSMPTMMSGWLVCGTQFPTTSLMSSNCISCHCQQTRTSWITCQSQKTSWENCHLPDHL